MSCPDEIAGDMNTTGVVAVGQTIDSSFEICEVGENVPPDSDWFAVELEYGSTYLFELTFDPTNYVVPPEIGVAAMFGIEETRLGFFGEFFVNYTARYSGTHYISAFQGGLVNDTNYQISASLIVDDTASDDALITMWPGFANTDSIEVILDRDTFVTQLIADRPYYFILNGAAGGLTGAHLQLEDEFGSIVAENGSTGGTTGLAYTPTQSGFYVVNVTGENTGDYSVINFVIDEAAVGASTTSEMTFVNGVASVEAHIGLPDDIDWHKVQLTQGDLVKITLQGSGLDYLETPLLIFRGPNGSVIHHEMVTQPDPANEAKAHFYYEVEQTGEHYVIARSSIRTYIGAYTATVEHTQTPIDQNVLFGRGSNLRLVVSEDQPVRLDQLVELHGLTPNWYQVYASVPLMRDGVIMQADHLYAIPGGELDLWELEDVVAEPKELYIQARVSNSWSQWQKFPVFGADSVEQLNSGQSWDKKVVTYRFIGEATEDYAEDEFESVVSLWDNPNVRNRFVETLEMYAESGFDLTFRYAGVGEVADMNVFMATGLPFGAASYLPGYGRGGDVILNADRFTNDSDLSDGSINFFTMQRHIAHTLGLNFVAGSELDATDSVMSTGAVSNGLFASSLGASDLWTLGQIYGSTVFDVNDPSGGPVPVTLGVGNSLKTIAVETRGIKIDASILNDAVVDLRDGGRSFVNGTTQTEEVYVGTGALVFEGTGSSGNDLIYGNGLKNRVFGEAGNDFLIGYENDDEMYGGTGTDIYIHYFGDGNDFVSDTGGIDTLCFIGQDQWHVGTLYEDYTFTRDGDYLTVNLTLDEGPSQGSVRIYNGFNNTDRIESLELWHGNTLASRISLSNILDQLADGQTSRFRETSSSDEYGLLVTPF